jgi:hypothetical protein
MIFGILWLTKKKNILYSNMMSILIAPKFDICTKLLKTTHFYHSLWLLSNMTHDKLTWLLVSNTQGIKGFYMVNWNT